MKNPPDTCPYCQSDVIFICHDDWACNTPDCFIFHGWKNYVKTLPKFFITVKSEIPEDDLIRFRKEWKKAIEKQNDSPWMTPLSV